MPGSAIPVTAPGAPRGLTVTAGDAQVSLSWQAPASDGGAAITGYRVYQGTSRKLVASATGTSATVKNLTNGTAYSFTVTAVNQAGEGPASGSAPATPTSAASTPGSPNGPTSGPGNGQSATPTAGASASASASATASTSAPDGGPTGPGAPGAPTGLTATAGNAEVGLSWTAPGGSPPASYHVYEGTSPGFALGNPVVSTTGTSATVTGLTNGTTYYFVVTAVGSDGTASGASAEASAQPTARAVLASATGKVPKPVIALLAAVAVAAVAAAAVLTARRLRKRPRRRPPAAPPADVRAVPEPGPPSPVSLHEIGLAETYVVRLEPLPAAIITTIEELERTS